MKSNWRNLVFAIAITLVFVPMVFLGVNTFFPDFEPSTECRAAIPVKACQLLEGNASAQQACLEEQSLNTKQTDECLNTTENERHQYEGFQFITILAICLFTSLIMLTKLDKNVLYGLFLGVVITAFIATIRYLHSKSLVGFILLVVLFFFIIYFIQKDKKLH